MRSGLKCHKYLPKLFASWHLFESAHLTSLGFIYVFIIFQSEGFAIKLIQVASLCRIKHIPVISFLNSFHKLISHKNCGVRSTHTQIVVAGIVLPLYKFREIKMPVFHIEAKRPFFFATTLYGPYGCINDLCESSRSSRNSTEV